MPKTPLGQGFVRTLAAALATVALLLVSLWFFIRYHEVQQTELSGYATAKAVAEQVSMQRKIYTHQIVPRAQLAGMDIDVDFETKANTLPVPVTLLNLVGAALANEFPGSRIRLYSLSPFTFRPAPELDAFAREALAATQRNPKAPFYRLEWMNGREVIRYAIADVMEQECVDCHNQHPQSPKRDWKVGDVRGVEEVTLPIDDLAARIHAQQLNATLWLCIGALVLLAGFLFFVRHDVTLIRREQLALTDPTTGLLTRRGALTSISTEMARAQRHQQPLSFVVFDIDHFKRVNDTAGHLVGDHVLAAVGHALAEVRQFDIVARWGGEEFLAVLPQGDAAAARAAAERLRRRVESIQTDGVSVTLSAGISQLQPGETLESAVARADAKLYEAKQAGRNAVR